MFPRTFQDFRSAIQPLAKPFYISFDQMGMDMQESVDANEQTGEQLTIMPTTDVEMR
jgi:hypothetical protein